MARRNTRLMAWLAVAAVATLALVLGLLQRPEPGNSPTESAPTPGGMTALEESPKPQFLGVVDEPSSARLCDSELWVGIDAIVPKTEPGTAWIAEARWKSLSTRSRAAVANWASQCTQSGAPIALVAVGTGEVLGHYSLERGLAHSP